jgi:1,4-alpha-glucan branching enzyme
MTKQKVIFSYFAPEAKCVELLGDFTGWQQSPLKLRKSKGGSWKATVPLAPGRYAYRLLVDGEWRDDPQCTTREPNEFGGENCIYTVNAA